MVMASAACSAGRKSGLQIILQTRESLLRAGQIAGLQGANQALIVCIRLAVFAKGLIRGRLRIVRQCLLKGRQRALGSRNAARLDRAADGVEILDDLAETVLVRRLIRAGCRRHACYSAHNYLLLKIFVTGVLTLAPSISDGIEKP
jgi:hypothetical protein